MEDWTPYCLQVWQAGIGQSSPLCEDLSLGLLSVLLWHQVISHRASYNAFYDLVSENEWYLFSHNFYVTYVNPSLVIGTEIQKTKTDGYQWYKDQSVTQFPLL